MRTGREPRGGLPHRTGGVPPRELGVPWLQPLTSQATAAACRERAPGTQPVSTVTASLPLPWLQHDPGSCAWTGLADVVLGRGHASRGLSHFGACRHPHPRHAPCRQRGPEPHLLVGMLPRDGNHQRMRSENPRAGGGRGPSNLALPVTLPKPRKRSPNPSCRSLTLVQISAVSARSPAARTFQLHLNHTG